MLFSYKNKRKLSETEEVETLEGFNLNEVLDFAIVISSERESHIFVRLKNKEDKDVVREFPSFNKKGEIINIDSRSVRREENSAHIINDKEDIERFKKILE